MYGRYMFAALCLAIVSCGDGGSLLPDGSVCALSEECASDLCLNARCLDPAGDDDRDGLSTSVELLLGLDPLHPDTDRDSLPDGLECGTDPARPSDMDGDGRIDALESVLLDADHDCLVDQYDPLDATEPASSAELVPHVCMVEGVCAPQIDLVTATCSGGVALCDYSAVSNWNVDEWWCDGQDNNCNGLVDEGFYYSGVSVGFPCAGVGECGPGVVECDPSGFGTRCSSNPGASADASRPEVCDGLDNDCDGASDDGIQWEGIALGDVCDGTGDCGTGVVECLPDGEATCSTMEGGSGDQVVEEYCDARDNDCDGVTDEAWSGDPASLCTFRGICSQYPHLVGVVCSEGVLECDFSYVPGYSGPMELYCDELDDDCDGQVDEEVEFAVREAGVGVRSPGQSCGLGACSGGFVRCAFDGLSGECSTASLASVEVCNDLDDDCDGRVDEDLFKFWKGPPTVLFDTEPQPRVSSMMVAVEPVELQDQDALTSGIYVCGGAGSVVSGAPSGFTGSCWRWDPITLRFEKLPSLPPVESGAMVYDAGRSRLLVAGIEVGSGILRLWALEAGSGAWVLLAPELPAIEVVSGGIRTQGTNLFVLVRTPAGIAVASYEPDAESFATESVNTTIESGSFAAFDPSGGFYIWHACEDERFTYLEFVGLDGVSRLDPLDQPETCVSSGAAVMVESNRMLVMSGFDRDGHINGTIEFVSSGGVWQRRDLTQSGSSGAVAWPSMAVGASGVMAFSGVTQEGRGLRRMLRFDENGPAWSVVSVVAGPSPRAGGVAFTCDSTASAYFLGGWGSEPGGPQPVKDNWRLNLVTGLFAQSPAPDELGAAIDSVAATDQEGGVVYVFGGNPGVPGSSGGPLDTFMSFGCDSGRWERLQSGPPARWGHSLVWAGDRLILFGGLNNEGFLGDVWTWTSGDGWVHVGDSGLRFGHNAFWDGDGDRMLVVGGRPGADVSAWYPRTGQWEVIHSEPILDSSEGLAWFDPASRSLLYLSATSSEALIFRFWDEQFEVLPFSGLQADILSGFTLYDRFNRRGLLFGGVDPEAGTVGSIVQMSQGCPM